MPEDPENAPAPGGPSSPESTPPPPAPPPPPYPQSPPAPSQQMPPAPPPYPQQGPPPYPQQTPYPPQLPPYPEGGGYGTPGGGYPGGGYPSGGYGGAPYGQPQGFGTPFATYGARLGGWLLDWLIVGVAGYVISIIFNAAKVATVTVTTNTTANGVTTHHVNTFSVLGPILQVLIAVLYGAILIGSARGQTVGMMAVGAKAVDIDTGRPIGFGRALGRAVFEYLLFILLIIPWVVDMLFPAWDAKSQTLHDKVSRTVVLKASVTTPV